MFLNDLIFFCSVIPSLLFVCLMNQGRIKGVPRRLFCFVYLMILDVVCRYLLLFLLFIVILVIYKYKNR